MENKILQEESSQRFQKIILSYEWKKSLIYYDVIFQIFNTFQRLKFATCPAQNTWNRTVTVQPVPRPLPGIFATRVHVFTPWLYRKVFSIYTF